MDLKAKKTIESYNKFAKLYSQYSYSAIPQYELERFVAVLSKKACILDAGCGAGRDVEYFTKAGFKVTGIDLSTKLISEAKKKIKSKKASFRKMDLNELKLKKGSFDGIWCCSSLIHSKRNNIVKILKKFKDVLKKEGILFFDVLEGEGEKLVKSKEVGFLPRFFSFFSQEEIEAVVKEAGFFINDVYTTRTDENVFINIFARNV